MLKIHLESKSMNKKILFLIFLAVIFILPVTSFAAVSTIQDLVNNAVISLSGIGAGLATISFVVAGIMYLSATGNPARMGTAKIALMAAIIGIVIIVLAATAQVFVKTFFGF